MSELKPCPFCGNGDAINIVSGGWHLVRCFYCGFLSNSHYKREDAIKDWNTRPTEDALTAKLADIRRIFDGLGEQPTNEAIIHAMSEIKSVVYDA